MHPIQHAIAMLHHHTGQLHKASQAINGVEDHKKLAEVLIALLPEVLAAAQDVVIAAISFISAR